MCVVRCLRRCVFVLVDRFVLCVLFRLRDVCLMCLCLFCVFLSYYYCYWHVSCVFMFSCLFPLLRLFMLLLCLLHVFVFVMCMLCVLGVVIRVLIRIKSCLCLLLCICSYKMFNCYVCVCVLAVGGGVVCCIVCCCGVRVIRLCV